MTNEVIIRASISPNGGIHYDVYLDPADVELPEDSDDGGICTSGMHNPDCRNDACEGCPEAMAKPYDAADWHNALDMAKDQAIDLLKRT